MSCGATRKRLFDYVERLLSPTVTEAVKRHLATCAACREIETGLEEARSILQGVGRAQAPATLKEAVCQRVAQSGSRRSMLRRGQLENLLSGYRGWAAVTAVLVVGILFWYGLRWAPSPARVPVGSQKPIVQEDGPMRARNEMDEFVDFCLERHSEFVSDLTLSDEANLAVIQKARVTVVPARLGSGRGTEGLSGKTSPRAPMSWPAAGGQGRQWWFRRTR